MPETGLATLGPTHAKDGDFAINLARSSNLLMPFIVLIARPCLSNSSLVHCVSKLNHRPSRCLPAIDEKKPAHDGGHNPYQWRHGGDEISINPYKMLRNRILLLVKHLVRSRLAMSRDVLHAEKMSRKGSWPLDDYRFGII